MVYEIRNEYLTVKVKRFGAELTSVKAADGTEYLWFGDPNVWDGQSPVLFPYIGRLTDGKYSVNGNEYVMRIHGIAPYMEFAVSEQMEDSLTLKITSDEETLKEYPFAFCFSVTYALEKNRLQITYTAENFGEERMYFAIGGHPGIAIPFEEGTSFEDYAIEFADSAVPDRIGFTETCFLNGQTEPFKLEEGRKLALRHDLFDRDAIVLKNTSRSLTISAEKGTKKVTCSYGDFAYLGFWHMPHTEAPYVCVEPWSSLPARQDRIEDLGMQSDLLYADAGASVVKSWTLSFE